MYIYILMIAALLAAIYMYVETTMLKVERIKLCKSRNPIKIAQLSDIHIGIMNVSASKIKDVLNKENPDIIILTGDYIEKENQIPKFLSFLDLLPSKPSFACFGNHDYKEFLRSSDGLDNFADKIEKKGIRVLRNSSTEINIMGRQINIVGIEDIRYRKNDVNKAFQDIKNLNNFTIAFSHNPDILFHLGKYRPDILLAGHFHGGQIWMPFHLEFKLLRKEKLSKMQIYKGLNNINNQKIYISRGLGNVMFPFRFGSTPEITIIEV